MMILVSSLMIFGDGWKFLLKIEKIIQEESVTAPSVLEGKGYGIFENIGGVGGLEEVFEQFKKKKGDMYEYYADKFEGDDYNLEDFDIDEMNRNLKGLIKLYDKAYKEPCY